ncbi:hypothetical protein RJ640_003529 [Escallonia rubra]|uniref:Uncharacterized protein n=1 Tax=Escallonia rubra TaxID=112253 RepID=A0AA88R0G0_9ASTE|nr:hypothetical protein RJ640_003529 [Escallonia rubra]
MAFPLPRSPCLVGSCTVAQRFKKLESKFWWTERESIIVETGILIVLLSESKSQCHWWKLTKPFEVDDRPTDAIWQHGSKGSVEIMVLTELRARNMQYMGNIQSSENAEDLLSYAWKCWREGTCLNLVDPILKADMSSLQDIERCIHFRLLCVQKLAADRPSMAAVILMLSSDSVTLPVPSEPA